MNMKLHSKFDDLVAESHSPSAYDYDEGSGGKHGRLGTKNGLTLVDKHIDVHEDEGWITIPCKELPDNWSEEPDMIPLKSLDRPFVFPGEQVHILACLYPCKQDMENKGQNEALLKRFRNSHFFARIAEEDEALWSRRKTEETYRGSTATIGGNFLSVESNKDSNKTSINRGSLDASTSGGVAKNNVTCNLLPNGDIVVLLQVNIGVEVLLDPVIEILQFEKHQSTTTLASLDHSKEDPYGDLLKWLLPVQNSILPSRFSSDQSPNATARSSLTKANIPSSFGSQNYLLGHLRSHSMSSLSTKGVVASSNLLTPSSRQNIDWDLFSSSNERISEGLLSFRGVPLEPERFSVRCGLEGIYSPGRRWRRNIEIIQPLEIHCFAVDCNTEDLLCVQIKNVSPAHLPDIVIYLDAITLTFEEASKGGSPLSLPITCVESGNDHGLPNLPLRKGEEHSFILKPETSIWSCNGEVDKNYQLPQLQGGSAGSSVHSFTNLFYGASPDNRYSVVVSCRCNYTESRLFFKQPTNWQPHIQKDLLISVSSQMSPQTLDPNNRISHLPVQVLTLEASNLTNEDLTLTLVAPSSLTSSLVSLDCSPASPMSPFYGRSWDDLPGVALQRLCSVSQVLDQKCGGGSEQAINVLSRNNLGHTHMWLKSRVPLGCVPSRSMVTVKLELLPLTDGIITLDSLRINVGRGEYAPEKPLKINATSSISMGVI